MMCDVESNASPGTSSDEENWSRAIAEGFHPFPVELPKAVQLRLALRVRAWRTTQLQQFLARQLALLLLKQRGSISRRGTEAGPAG